MQSFSHAMTSLSDALDVAQERDGYYEAILPPYCPFLVSAQGKQVIASDVPTTETLLAALHTRAQQLTEFMEVLCNRESTSRQLAQVPVWAVSKEYGLRPHVQIPHKRLGKGSEGSVFQFQYVTCPVALKFYDSIPCGEVDSGLEQFRALIEAQHLTTVFKTPQPYFATNFLCVMEDFSSFQDYFVFIRQHPEEEIRLLTHLLWLAEHDELVADIGDIVLCYDGCDTKPFRPRRGTFFNMYSCESSSVFVTDFHPGAAKDEDRFKLATVDVHRDDAVRAMKKSRREGEV